MSMELARYQSYSMAVNHATGWNISQEKRGITLDPLSSLDQDLLLLVQAAAVNL